MGGGGGGGGFEFIEPVTPSRGKLEAFQLEIDRKRLLAYMFEKVSTAMLPMLQKKWKMTLQGEEGIDSGGLSKEGILLLSRQAAICARHTMKMCAGVSRLSSRS